MAAQNKINETSKDNQLIVAQNKNNEANKGNQPMVAETGQEKKKPIRIMEVLWTVLWLRNYAPAGIPH